MTPITDLIPQYESEASRLAAHKADLEKQYHTTRDYVEKLRLMRKIEVVEQEYYEAMAGIRAMRKYEKKG